MFLDTSGLLHLQNSKQPLHAQAVRLFRSARRRVTHSYVIAELIALAEARSLPRSPVLQFARDIQKGSPVELVYVDEKLHDRGLRLLEQRLDKRWSLCDGVSFVLMGDYRETEALTTDHHSEQAGFVRLLK